MNTGVSRRLASIRERISAACSRAGREASEITLVGAAKRQPDDRILAAASAGLADFGENQVQEAERHSALLRETGVRWHLIGPLQSNKARRAARLFDCVHSIDRLKIARRLDSECRAIDKKIQGLVEINIGAEPSKHGFAPGEFLELRDELLELENLEVVGVMAIPPVAANDDEARDWFRRLRELRDQAFAFGRERRHGLLSMGMSADFEIAIEEGATHIRIGTDLFGARAPRH